MPRPSRLLAVLLIVSGCSGLPECGAPAPAPALPPVPAPPAAVAPARGGRDALAEGALYAKTWWIILHSSATPGEGGEVLAALARTGLPAQPRRLSTTVFQELRPCLEVVVARTFPGRAEALDYQARLREAGIAAEVRYAGPLEAGREALCEAGARAEAALIEGLHPPGAPRFLESHVGRTFMLLGEGRESRVLEPLDVRRGVWMAPAEEDPTGRWSRGDTVDVYGARGLVRTDCAVKGFVWINRGVPAFDYFLREPPPESPGCGEPWAFAELDCEVPAEALVGGFALPAGAHVPVFFTPVEPPAELVAPQEAALRASPRFAELRTEGAYRAERVGEQLDVEVHSFAYGSGDWRVVVSVARFRVGEGHSVCGMDYDQQLTRVGVVQPGAGERVLPASELSGDELVGVMDLEGDGHLELLLRATWPQPWVRLVREDGSALAGAVVESCDSGC